MLIVSVGNKKDLLNRDVPVNDVEASQKCLELGIPYKEISVKEKVGTEEVTKYRVYHEVEVSTGFTHRGPKAPRLCKSRRDRIK